METIGEINEIEARLIKAGFLTLNIGIINNKNRDIIFGWGWQSSLYNLQHYNLRKYL